MALQLGRLFAATRRLFGMRWASRGPRAANAFAEPSVPPGPSMKPTPEAPPPPLRPAIVRLFLDDGTVVEPASDPLVQRRVAQLLSAARPPSSGMRAGGRSAAT